MVTNRTLVTASIEAVFAIDTDQVEAVGVRRKCWKGPGPGADWAECQSTHEPYKHQNKNLTTLSITNKTYIHSHKVS